MAPMMLSKGALAAALLMGACYRNGGAADAFQPSTAGLTGAGLTVARRGRRSAAPTGVVPRPPLAAPPTAATSTALSGKMWDKLDIEEDAPGEYYWYVINCIAGMEMQLLQQVKRAAAEMSPRDRKNIKKFAVPTKRSLRSHGARNVVDVKALYAGYVFCHIRLCPATYEPLQVCPLTRSWMGTKRLKGNTLMKLPVIPMALNDDEVEKFKLLDDATDAMHAKHGKDYDGKGDAGADLLDQYKGYEVGSMVKVLNGKHTGEDAIVKRLKEGRISVRLYTYGTSFDEWYEPTDLRPMSDAEVLKGFTGPDGPVTQRDYEESIGRRTEGYGRSGDLDQDGRGGRGTLRNQLMENASGGGGRGGGGGDGRNTRQDRQARGERGGRKDQFGRTREEKEQEDKNWREYRAGQRAEQSAAKTAADIHGTGSWGLKGDKPWMYEDTQDISGEDDGKEQEDDQRRMRRSREEQQVAAADRDWQSAGPSSSSAGGAAADTGSDDDFFSALMDDLSDTLDSAASSGGGGGSNQQRPAAAPAAQQQDEDDFFASLMSDLSDEEPAAAAPPPSSSRQAPSSSRAPAGGKIDPVGGDDDDDFFAALEADLSDTLDSGAASSTSSSAGGAGDDSDFFDSLEEEMRLDMDAPTTPSAETTVASTGTGGGEADDFDFFSALEADLSAELGAPAPAPAPAAEKKMAPAPVPADATPAPSGGGGGQDLAKLTVPILKGMLRERGLKVGGKKAELIERLGA